MRRYHDKNILLRMASALLLVAVAALQADAGVRADEDSLVFARAQWDNRQLAQGVNWLGYRFQGEEALFGSPQNINILRIEQDKADVRFTVDFVPGQKIRTSDAARRQNALAAVNGTYYSTEPPYGPTGYFKVQGQTVNSLMAATGNMVAIDSSGRLTVASLKNDPAALAAYPTLMAGAPLLLREGEVALATVDTLPAPRTVVGVCGDTVWLVTVDGRSEQAGGTTLYQSARILQWLGAETGLNLDGGGSTTMFVRQSGTPSGVVNLPSDRFLGIFHRLERRVGNVLLLLASTDGETR